MKYWRTFLLAIQVNYTYRANLFLWFVVGSMSSFGMLLVWFAIMGDRPSLNGFTKGDFLIYYVYMTVGWYIVGGVFAGSLGRDIKYGEINKTLLKPYNIVLERALREQAWKFTSLILSIPAVLIVFLLFGTLITVSVTPEHVMLTVISLILGGVLFALFQATIGSFAFWMSEVWPVAEVFDVLLHLFGGNLAPLILLPLAVQRAASVLPFKYIFYTPVEIMLQRADSPWTQIGIQFIFVTVTYVLFYIVWNLGIRRYEANGG